MQLRYATYREKAFWKSWLMTAISEAYRWISHKDQIQMVEDRFAASQDLEYNLDRDVIYNRSGSSIPVSREPSESWRLLFNNGVSDANCHAAVV